MENKIETTEKKEWQAPLLTVIDIESETNGAPLGTASADGLGYS